MIGLLVRLVILFGVVAGVTYAVTKAARGRRERERLKAIEDDIHALKAGTEHGVFTDEERGQILAKVEDDARSAGADLD